MRGASSAVAAWLLVASLARPIAAGSPQFVPDLRPFADYEHTASVVMPAFDRYGSGALTLDIARHLPPGVTLVLFGHSTDPEARARVLARFAQVLAPDRITYLTVRKARTMTWSRDAMPQPLLDAHGGLVLTDAKYFGGFEPDEAIARLFDARLVTHRFRFEGGNLMANHLGDCATVDSRDTRKITDADFTRLYGCRAVMRLPKRGGIGHIDERARFVNGTTVVTDTAEYARAFSDRGFDVVIVPRPGGRDTYVNSLLVNGTAFVPAYQRPDDTVAAAIYRDLGFTVVTLDARELARKGLGALHCLTMNYPVRPVRTMPGPGPVEP